MNPRNTWFLGVLLLMVVLVPATAFAVGTPKGTIIKNVASATYSDAGGNSMGTIKSDTAFTTVEQVAGIALTPVSYYRVVGDSVNVYFKLRLTNTGNSSDSFTLSAADNKSWAPALFLDADSNGTPDNLTNVTTVSSLAADANYYFVAKVFTPDGVANTTMDTLLVTATSVFDAAVKKLNRDTVVVQRVDFANSGTKKTSSNSSPKPQDVITYNITFLNTGSSNVKNWTLTDVLPSQVSYNNGSAAVDSGGGTPSYSAGTLSWNAGSILPGRGVGFHFQATVNSLLPAGSSIRNSASIAYVDSISGRNKKDSVYVTISVSDSLGWVVRVDVPGGSFATNNAKDSVNVGMQQYFVLKLTNRGNRTDTATAAKTSSLPLTWSVYYDKNGNGTFESGTDSLVSSFTGTGPVAQNGTVTYLLVNTAANSVTDRSVDSARYVFKGLTHASDTAWGYTKRTVKAPILSMKKFVTLQNGRSRPGDTLVYTVKYTNTGSGTATAVVITDASPTNTSYISGSVTVSADSTTWNSQTDAGDSDAVTVNSGNVVYTLPSNVGPGAVYIPDNSWKGYLRFKVRIQ